MDEGMPIIFFKKGRQRWQALLTPIHKGKGGETSPSWLGRTRGRAAQCYSRVGAWLKRRTCYVKDLLTRESRRRLPEFNSVLSSKQSAAKRTSGEWWRRVVPEHKHAICVKECNLVLQVKSEHCRFCLSTACMHNKPPTSLQDKVAHSLSCEVVPFIWLQRASVGDADADADGRKGKWIKGRRGGRGMVNNRAERVKKNNNASGRFHGV